MKGEYFEIIEIRGYSGHYLLQKNKGFACNSELDGMSSGSSAERYLESGYPHHIHAIRRHSDKKIFEVGKLDMTRVISKITFKDGHYYFTYQDSSSHKFSDLRPDACKGKRPLDLRYYHEEIGPFPKIGVINNSCVEVLIGTGGEHQLGEGWLEQVFYGPNKKLLLLC